MKTDLHPGTSLRELSEHWKRERILQASRKQKTSPIQGIRNKNNLRHLCSHVMGEQEQNGVFSALRDDTSWLPRILYLDKQSGVWGGIQTFINMQGLKITPPMYPCSQSYWQMCSTKPREFAKKGEATEPRNQKMQTGGWWMETQNDHCAPTGRAGGLESVWWHGEAEDQIPVLTHAVQTHWGQIAWVRLGQFTCILFISTTRNS